MIEILSRSADQPSAVQSISSTHELHAGVAELAYAQDLKSWAAKAACGFDSRPRHSQHSLRHRGVDVEDHQPRQAMATPDVAVRERSAIPKARRSRASLEAARRRHRASRLRAGLQR